MNKEEIDKLFRRIELDKSNDSCGFEFADGFGCTFDNIATCYDDRLKLYDLVKQLQNNWNELKDWLEDAIKDIENIEFADEFDRYERLTLRNILSKMQEIESRKK